MRSHLRVRLGTLMLVGLAASGFCTLLTGSAKASSPTFTLTPLLLANGSSEPEISVGNDGTMAMVSLQWLFASPFGTRLWTGPFGSTPTPQGVVDGSLQHPGKSVFGGADADVDIGSTSTLHISTLISLLNAAFNKTQFGVSAITCPSPAIPAFAISQCTAQILDKTTDDRPWVTSDGPHVYVSYHDAGNSTLIHTQRSDDDGFTWKKVGDPIVGQGGITGDATHNNAQGKMVADPITQNVYTIYAAGQTGMLKGRTFTPNQIIVSRSSDMGETWTANVAFTAAPGTSLANFFPALTVDPTNGNLYAAWSDGQNVYFKGSTDQGSTWTSLVRVNAPAVITALFPWVAAYNGTIDVVYYGTNSASNLDPSADWHVYFTQLKGGTFTQTK